jgi:hypothetical protein
MLTITPLRRRDLKNNWIGHVCKCMDIVINILILLIKKKEEFEDTKGVIRIHISKKNRQHNGQKKKVQKNKQRSTKLTHKTKD